jgi:hypothetical protein
VRWDSDVRRWWIAVALSLAVGRVFASSADAAGTTYAETGLGFQPKVLIVWSTPQSGTSTPTDNASTSQHLRWALGFATGTSNRACALAQTEEGSATTDSDSMVRTDCVCGQLSNAGAISGRVDLQSFDADGFTLIVDQQHNASAGYYYIALGGSDLTDAACGTWTEPGSTGVSAVVSGLSFQPTSAFLAGGHATALDTRVDDFGWFLGALTATDQWVMAYGENHGLTDGDPWSYGRNGECAAMFDPGAAINAGALNFRAVFNAFTSDGFSLNVTERAASRLFIYLALRGPRVKVTSLTTRTDGNDIAITGAGVGTPRGCFVASNGLAEHAADTPTNGGVMVLGAASSPTNRHSSMAGSEDAAATTNIYSGVEFDQIFQKLAPGTPTTDALMDLVSLDSDGATFVMDDPEPTTGSWAGVVLFGDAAAAGGSLLARLMQEGLFADHGGRAA